jgi:predicted RNA-binding Zn-ribbon protein involved in translation (DUF1610 family)
MRRDEMKAQLMVAAEHAIEEMLARKTAPEQIQLSEIEQLALETREAIGSALVEGLVQESEASRREAARRCPDCGEAMVRRGRRARRVVTEAGAVMVERDYCFCVRCGQHVFPPG